MLRLAKTVGIAGSGIVASSSAFAKGRAASIKSVSLLKDNLGQQKLRFELDKSVRHSIFTLHSPERVVIDLKDTQHKTHLKIGRATKNSKLLKKIRQASRNKTDLRIVLDLNKRATASAKLKPGKSGYLLEVALKAVRKVKPESPIEKASKAVTTVVGRRATRKPMVIAIDAGHGGKDPGAVGRRGTKEKSVVFQIAKRLANKINRQSGMKAVLIRDGDYYVSLRKRIAKARSKKADLFISVHADAVNDRRASGASVYVLSSKGASDEAASRLAQRENASNLLGEVSLAGKDKVLAYVLLDLSQSAALSASLEVGSEVIYQLSRIGKVHRRKVQQADFLVLKSPDVPSILVETAYISNPTEEKRLRSPRHQQKLADAILAGVRRYFHGNPPPDTYIALKMKLNSTPQVSHTITRGDTLSEIAERYRVSMAAIRARNKLANNNVRVGQTLQIPVFAGT